MFDFEAGYAYDDPKHPDFYERSVEAWDNRDKGAYRGPLVSDPDEPVMPGIEPRCPQGHTGHVSEARFCTVCGMPLIR